MSKVDIQTLDGLLSRKAQTQKPTVVCLCGSTRFSQAYQQANLSETLAGRIVLSIGVNTKSDDELATAGIVIDKDALDLLHLHKIDLADEVLILNVEGYVGTSTRREILYATLRKKRIRWLEEHAALAVCEACGTLYRPADGYHEPDEYSYCADCCHW